MEVSVEDVGRFSITLAKTVDMEFFSEVSHSGFEYCSEFLPRRPKNLTNCGFFYICLISPGTEK